jgi:hypothetical protein
MFHVANFPGSYLIGAGSSMERASSSVPPPVDDLHEVLARSYRNAVQDAAEHCSFGYWLVTFPLLLVPLPYLHANSIL